MSVSSPGSVAGLSRGVFGDTVDVAPLHVGLDRLRISRTREAVAAVDRYT